MQWNILVVKKKVHYLVNRLKKTFIPSSSFMKTFSSFYLQLILVFWYMLDLKDLRKSQSQQRPMQMYHKMESYKSLPSTEALKK